MNVYLVDSNEIHYDTYDSFICCAKDEASARLMHPSGSWENEHIYQEWCKKEDCIDLVVTLVGLSIDDEEKVILASYNAS
jgi:hypothetical protein